MSEPTELKAKEPKNPVEAAAQKLREIVGKEAQKKIDDQLKKTLDAIKIARNEKAELQRLLQEAEGEKSLLKELLGEIE